MRCYQNKRKLDGARVRLKTGRALSKTGIFRAFNPFFLDFCHSVLLVAVDVGAPK